MARNKNSINANYRKGYKVRFYPDEKQAKFIDDCIDVSRYIYNWAVEKEKKHYELFKQGKVDKQQLNSKELRKLLIIHRSTEAPWLKEYPNEMIRNALKRVTDSYDLFFKHATKAPPHFKSKKRSKKSFTTRVDRFHFAGNKFRLEGLKRGEYIDLKYDFGLDNATLHNIVIIKDNTNKYWLTFSTDNVENKTNYFKENNVKISEPIGIDVNKRQRYVLSDGTIIMQPNTEHLDFRIKRLNRKCQKDIKRALSIPNKLERTNPDYELQYSKNALKRKNKLNKLYKKKHNIVMNQIYDVSNYVCRMNPKAVVMEDLKCRHFFIGHYMNKQLHGIPFLTMQKVMEYKCKQYNLKFILAPNKYPSSKRCSNCGSINTKLKLYQRTFKCPICGFKEDRDINAAKNLQQLAYNLL